MMMEDTNINIKPYIMKTIKLILDKTLTISVKTTMVTSIVWLITLFVIILAFNLLPSLATPLYDFLLFLNWAVTISATTMITSILIINTLENERY